MSARKDVNRIRKGKYTRLIAQTRDVYDVARGVAKKGD